MSAKDLSAGDAHGVPLPSFTQWPRADAARALSVSEQIAARLGEQIVDGSFEPGERLLEEQISADFGVSRNPVREALRILERDGFVSISARRGAQVLSLSPDEAMDLFEIEGELYGLMGRRLAEGRDPAAMALIDQAVAKLEACVAENGSCIDYLLLVNRLSLDLSVRCGNKSLNQVLSLLLIRNVGYTRSSLKCPARQVRLLAAFQGLRDAVAAGRARKAEEAARAIVADIASAVLKLSGQVPHADPVPA